MDTESYQVLGYEALSRDPEGKLSILDLFKKYQAVGKLRELKCICLKKQIKLAQQAGLKRVFVNVEFDMLSHLEPFPKPPRMEIVFEIAETEAMRNLEYNLEVARRWRRLGHKFAIDDFGAGFISLSFIAQFMPDHIKIDRSTILQSVSSTKFRAVLRDMLVAIRSYLREGIIAEGVETVEELQAVKEMGIYMIQGFLLGQPRGLKQKSRSREVNLKADTVNSLRG